MTDDESKLRGEYLRMLDEISYDLYEHGYDAIQDGLPHALDQCISEAIERLEAVRTIGVRAAYLRRNRLAHE